MSQSPANGPATGDRSPLDAGRPSARQAFQNDGMMVSPLGFANPPGALVYLIEGVNPQPWEAPEAQVIGRGKVHMHKTEQLRFYQQAVSISFMDQNPNFVPLKTGVPLWVRFYFWREIEVVEGKGGKIAQSNVADATNLQKALEDALQDVLYGNDTLNHDVRSRIMEQDIGVDPKILIVIAPDPGLDALEAAFVGQAVKDLHKDLPDAPSNILPNSGDDLF